jgi:hypothetical protein
MKIWTKIKLTDIDKDSEAIANSLTNYLYREGPLTTIKRKYNISSSEIEELDSYTANRIMGLLLLYMVHDTKRINDIVNKYNTNSQKKITPELEGYLDK